MPDSTAYLLLQPDTENSVISYQSTVRHLGLRKTYLLTRVSTNIISSLNARQLTEKLRYKASLFMDKKDKKSLSANPLVYKKR